MQRGPPSSSLFPYTTLFRSGTVLVVVVAVALVLLAMAVKIVKQDEKGCSSASAACTGAVSRASRIVTLPIQSQGDRKSTRLNSSHPSISYAVFCLKKEKQSW